MAFQAPDDIVDDRVLGSIAAAVLPVIDAAARGDRQSLLRLVMTAPDSSLAPPRSGQDNRFHWQVPSVMVSGTGGRGGDLMAGLAQQG